MWVSINGRMIQMNWLGLPNISFRHWKWQEIMGKKKKLGLTIIVSTEGWCPQSRENYPRFWVGLVEVGFKVGLAHMLIIFS
jgi:hypothetical protein